jgi:hypothetical protein
LDEVGAQVVVEGEALEAAEHHEARIVKVPGGQEVLDPDLQFEQVELSLVLHMQRTSQCEIQLDVPGCGQLGHWAVYVALVDFGGVEALRLQFVEYVSC